ncbi:MAG: hypothetical protein IKE85_04235 [Mogibacterium sp.]|nr:hypothetical protein [Mogibacterium sp.]
MKKIIITGGPTNEQIDEVMKITNMSTGGTSVALAESFASAGYEVVAILNNMVRIEPRKNLKVIRIENTHDMLNAIENEARQDNTDAIIHAAAVGDYCADFSFLLEDMADEIFSKIGKIKSAEDILAIMNNPKCKLDSSSKISSYQENLTVKLGLTPKIISKLRFWFPNTLLIGCKLLDGVEKGELFDVATALCNKNHMDYILANDLRDLRQGDPARYLINKDGFTQIVLKNTDAIFKFVDDKLQ